jgi:hypothetical protein
MPIIQQKQKPTFNFQFQVVGTGRVYNFGISAESPEEALDILGKDVLEIHQTISSGQVKTK